MSNYSSYKPSNIREENIKQIIRIIRDSDDYYSRADISRKLSLSAPSVSSIIKLLIEKNILSEISVGDSSYYGGRKPILLDLNSECGYIVGIVIVENQITLALSDCKGNIVNANKIQYNLSSSSECLDFLETKLTNFLENNDINKNKLLGIGVSVPGVFDNQEGKIKLAPTIRMWQKIKIRERLVDKYGCRVLIENATNSAALGEMWKGKINNRKNAVYIKIGSGIGAGIILNGKLYKGFQNLAGEIGFFLTDKTQIPEEKSDVGELEDRYSINALVRRVSEMYDSEDIDFNFVVKEFKAGNKKINELLKTASINIAMVIANMICVLNPQAVVVGGEYAKIAPYFIDRIDNIVKKSVPVKPDILVSQLGKKVYYFGAIAQVMSKLEDSIIDKYFGD